MVLVVLIICGVICALVASSKGRNPIGWFFIGFFFGILGIVISLVVSNLKEARLKEEHVEIEQRRLREQLHQERLKTEQLRKYTQTRLDIHDKALEIDTRNIGPLLDSGNEHEMLGDGEEFPFQDAPPEADDTNTEFGHG